MRWKVHRHEGNVCRKVVQIKVTYPKIYSQMNVNVDNWKTHTFMSINLTFLNSQNFAIRKVIRYNLCLWVWESYTFPLHCTCSWCLIRNGGRCLKMTWSENIFRAQSNVAVFLLSFCEISARDNWKDYWLMPNANQTKLSVKQRNWVKLFISRKLQIMKQMKYLEKTFKLGDPNS